MLPFQTVVCAIDFTPSCGAALVQAADVAERSHATLHLFHAVPLFRARLAAVPGGDVAATFQARVTAFVNETLGASDAAEVLAPRVHETHGVAPPDGVLRYAAEVQADLVVMGTGRPHGLRSALLGSTAGDVLVRSPVPVLVVPGDAPRPAARPDAPVLVAVDIDDPATPALRLGRAWAAAFGATVELASVLDMAAPLARGAAHDALRRLASESSTPVAAQHVLRGVPTVDLVALAGERTAGVIVAGTHGRRVRGRLGSVAETLARQAPCAVLVVPVGPLADAGSRAAA